MAGVVQLGDIVQISKVAWQLYQQGWSDSLNAATQYAQFGLAIRGLAESLDALGRMLNSAYTQIRSGMGLGAQGLPRWNLASLNDILGDYRSTIDECRRLLLTNQRYAQAAGPLRNIEWNILIQPQAAALQDRILHHHSKILILIKPLEIDLLSQIISRIEAVHGRVEEVYGLLTSNVPQAVRQQEQQSFHTLELPLEIVTKFTRAAEQGSPNQRGSASYPLPDLTEAFLLYLRQSTVNFQPVRTFDAPTAPVAEYLSLLKSVWLMGQIDQHADLHAGDGESHWPSYIKGLKLELSRECARFKPSCPDPILAPDLGSLSNSHFSIWPRKALESILPPMVQLPATMMDELLSVTLATPRPSLVQHLRLLRGLDGRMSAIISAVDHSGDEERVESRTLDFNLDSAGLIPLYAVSFDQGPLSVVLRTESVMTELAFTESIDLLRFQRALTGYKIYRDYSQSKAMVELITSDRKMIRVSTTHVQLWIPKELEGRASTAPAADEDQNSVSRRTSTASRFPSQPSLYSGSNDFALGQSPLTPDPLTSRLGFLNIHPNQEWPSMGSSPSSSSSSSGTPRGSIFSQTSVGPGINRTISMGSIQTTNSASTARESNSVYSSRSKATNITSATSRRLTNVDGGTGRGYIQQKPAEPLLVLLAKAASSSQSALPGSIGAPSPLSMVVIELDERVAPNYERCRCQSHPEECDMTALERDKGKDDLVARIIEADGLDDWDLMRLRSSGRLSSTADLSFSQSGTAAAASRRPKALQRLRRVTLKFSDAKSRYEFSGRPCSCNKGRTTGELMACLRDKHQGLLGELRQIHKKDLARFEEAQRKKKDVMTGPMADR